MGFSANRYRREQQVKRWKIHPVWRGIGCALIILIPIMAWYSARLFLQADRNLSLPWDLTKTVVIRHIQVPEIDKAISAFNRFTASNKLDVGQFVFTVIFMVIGFGILSLIYALLYRVAGPPRYGPLDIPPSSMRR